MITLLRGNSLIYLLAEKYGTGPIITDKYDSRNRRWHIWQLDDVFYIFDTTILKFQEHPKSYPEDRINVLVNNTRGKRGYISSVFGKWGNWGINEYKVSFSGAMRRWIDADTDELVSVSYDDDSYKLQRFTISTLGDMLWQRATN